MTTWEYFPVKADSTGNIPAGEFETVYIACSLRFRLYITVCYLSEQEQDMFEVGRLTCPRRYDFVRANIGSEMASEVLFSQLEGISFTKKNRGKSQWIQNDNHVALPNSEEDSFGRVDERRGRRQLTV